MSKTVKKLLSVVLAVLVLAAGFSTMLGSFVMADDPEWTYDYQTLIPEFVGTSRDHELLKHNVEVSDGSKLVPEEFGFYDIVSVATNARAGGSGLWSENKDANGNPGTVVTDTMGLRVSDSFFLNANENRWYVTNRENIDDARAYVTYEVNAGSEFRVQYLTYTEAQWSAFNLSSKELRFLEILVSADGVNWVPAKVENDIVKDASSQGNYDRVTATVANVGANTRFVKVQFPANPHTVTYSQDKGQWVKNYYPQDAWFLTKVALEAPVAANTTETVVNFKDVDTDGTTVITTVNGVKTAPADVFYSYGKLAQKGNGLVAYGDELWKANTTWQNKLTWGQIAESDREFFLLVQPGTRFNLTFTDYNSHDDIAKGLVGAGNIETTDDFAVKVFTAATKQDFANGNYTEHKMVPALQNGGNGFFGTYNFIIPDGHAFVRILHPISGAIGSVMKLKEDGTPMEYLEANAIYNTAGNDWVHIKGITYTAPTFAVTDDYKTNLSSNAHYKNVFELQPVANKVGLGTQYNNATHLLHKADAEGNNVATAEKARTDEQLPYVLYEVKPGTVFKANLHLKYGSNNSLWRKSGYDKLAAELGFEEVHFELLTSPTGLAGSWTTRATLGKDGDTYVENTNMDSSAYDVIFGVPENAKYVKIVLHLRGTALSGTTVVSYDDAFGVYGASFTPAETNAEMTTYTYSSDTDTIAALQYSKNPVKFLATTGAVAAGNGVRHEESWTNIAGLGGILLDGYSGGRGYLVYNVQPGTVFEARTYVSSIHKANFQGVQNGLFEYIFSGSDTVGGTYNAITNTVTDYSVNDQYKTSYSTLQVTSFVVPEGMNFIKIEFPATMDSTNGTWANHGGSVNWVSFVPAKHVENGITFDYSKATVASVKDDLTQFGAIDASDWALKVTNNTVNYENFGTCIENVSGNYVAKVGKEWGKLTAPYMIFEVQPGTTFAANIFFHNNRTSINNTWLPAALAAGLITDESKFEFTFEASASKDGGWKNAADTSSLATGKIETMLYSVPEDCKYVKITFPQRGAVITNTKSVVTDGNGVERYAAASMNDMAFIEDVTYVPFGAADAYVVDENNYAAKSDKVLGNETKVEFEVYNFSEVEATANGIAAIEDAENAFVEYKVSNKEALVIKSGDELSFEVSYDGDKFVKAQVSAYSGVYTINTLDGKQYVRVSLDAGEAISAVSAAALAPTATFVTASSKQVIELDSFGATPAPTLNTARAGYTFSGWDNTVEALYLDATFNAEYDKAEETYAITVENGVILKVGGADCEADTTEATARFDDRVVIEAPATYSDGNMDLVFDKWTDAKGNTVSNSRKFSFLASGALALTAEYAEVKSDINPFIYNADSAIVTDNGAKWNMSVTWSVNVPAGATIKETGIVLAATETEMTKGAANTYAMKHSSVGTGKTLMFTVTGIADGATRYARPYAVLADDTVIYGTTVTATDAQ